MSATRGATATDCAVHVRGLVKRYGSLTAVAAGIDFEVRPGTILGVLGPNGAGKTTTIEILEGLKSADEGEVEVLGRSWKSDARGIRERIGVQLQETVLDDKLTCFELLRLFRSFYREGQDPEEALQLVDLGEKRNERVSALSGGQKQRLSLGIALLNEPELLFLDEPSTGLDPQARRRLWAVVERFRDRGGAVLMATHYMDEAERLADDLLVVDGGHVIARGSPASVIASLEAESVVELVPGEATNGLDEGLLEGVAGVLSVRRDGPSFVLGVSDTQAAIGALLALFAERGVVLEDLRTHRPTLEDVFVSLTGKHLRDA